MKSFLFQNAAVYCGTYHKYNSGSLKGEWITLSEYESEDEFVEYLRQLHEDEQDPEYMFQDCENMPTFVEGEPSWSEVVKTIELASHLWDCWIDEDIVNGAIEYENDLKDESPEKIEEWITEHYISSADDDRIVDDWLDDNGIPEHVRKYINRDELKEDLTADYTESNGHYFH